MTTGATGASRAPIRLSKSKFVSGVQCLKRLYFQIHSPELAGDEDEGQQFRFDQGSEVGRIARERFPGGRLVEYENALEDTAALLADPRVPAIFEATFEHAGVLVRIDVLERLPRNRWRLIEVKSSTSAKEHYLDDVAIQYFVACASGVNIAFAGLMHLNPEYRYDGRRLDLERLFSMAGWTAQVRKRQADLPALLRAQKRALGRPGPPRIDPGAHCSDPYPCEFFTHCNPPLPEGHIAFLPGLRERKRGDLIGLGVERIADIPEDFPLTETQARMRAAVLADGIQCGPGLGDWIAGLQYPLHFMDFETFSPAIPRFEGMGPYGHIPFQWSVHRAAAPRARMEHFAFLAEDARDPRRAFLESLLAALGKRGSIVVYNQAFESTRLNELVARFPRYAPRIRNVQRRLRDLLTCVRSNVAHPAFGGSFSIKSVLPALVPRLTYEGMEVADGEQAGLAWQRMLHPETGVTERKRLRTALLAYCRQDTLAMTAILDCLRTTGRLAARPPAR